MATKRTRRLDEADQRRGDVTLYRSADGVVQVECILMEETLWLTQQALAESFAVEIPAISKHLANIFESDELAREATVSILESVRQEGTRRVKRKIEYYSLDAIIAVGYRVNSYQATQFRIWATRILKEFLELSNYPILADRGRISALEAKLKAEQEYDVFRRGQDAEFISDFDREIKRLEGK